MQYREFLDLTDDEIKQIVTDIFAPVKIENIKRYKKWNSFTVDITTDGWGDGEGGTMEITDNIELTMDDISVDFHVEPEDEWKWKQFLLAKGCNELLKDNPYLEE
ncbi:hypothetical protein [Holdemanella biformis]|uniref:hypothetical protein n=1 Tax=Holdemanella biformis TaxID=1735 RepID=UPI00249165EA|nr:hypothetical protein [Holdemanella biformis]